MGQKYIIKQTKNGLIQMPIEKFPFEKYVDVVPEDIITIGNSLGIDWNTIDQNELVEGAISEAKEHPKVVTDTAKAVQVALDHLQEIPDYYTKLKTIEGTEKISKEDLTGARKKYYDNLRNTFGMSHEQALFHVKSHMGNSSKNEKDESKGRWVTIGGRKVFIEEGEEKPYDPDDPDHERP
jgi:hypothetical protein